MPGGPTCSGWRRSRCTTPSTTAGVPPARSRRCSMTENVVAIVGAGLAGSLLATLLARSGARVTVYERRDDPRLAAPERGRSINLAISARGLRALDEVGLRELSLSRALPMHGRMVHGPGGEPSFRPYSADGTHAI